MTLFFAILIFELLRFSITAVEDNRRIIKLTAERLDPQQIDTSNSNAKIGPQSNSNASNANSNDKTDTEISSDTNQQQSPVYNI